MSRHDLPKINQLLFPSELYFTFSSTDIKPTINQSCYYYLQISKDKIESFSDKWDVKKRLTNTYEYIHTFPPNSSISVCKYQPLSRAFFKLIEIIYEFKMHESPILKTPHPIKTFHLAEGPGGFIEAVSYIRANSHDNYIGMTLIDDSPTTPGWKKASTFLRKNRNVIIDYGEDGTGNLLNPANLLRVHKLHHNSVDFITGDGGFDFSVDYSKQELTASWLILAQICYAISIQKTGGIFILKMFDIFHNISVEFLYLLSIYYESVSIYKPLTSREANSERYIICQGYRNHADELTTTLIINKLGELLQAGIDCKYSMMANSILLRQPPISYVNAIEEANIMLAQRQINNIETTLNLISTSYAVSSTSYHGHRHTHGHKQDHSHNHIHNKFDTIRKQNLQKCIQWCIKYGLPYNSLSSFASSASRTFKYRAPMVAGAVYPNLNPNTTTHIYDRLKLSNEPTTSPIEIETISYSSTVDPVVVVEDAAAAAATSSSDSTAFIEGVEVGVEVEDEMEV